MAKILDLHGFKTKKTNSGEADLNELLQQASILCKEKVTPSDGVDVVGSGQMKSVFERRISQEIFSRRLISRDVFLCGIYISNILTDLILNDPESWWAIDYAFSENPLDLKRGGDMCFIICGIFPQRGNRRAMNVTYYQEMGENFYHHFYGKSKKEIGSHMSNNFRTMTEVVQSCIRDF